MTSLETSPAKPEKGAKGLYEEARGQIEGIKDQVFDFFKTETILDFATNELPELMVQLALRFAPQTGLLALLISALKWVWNARNDIAELFSSVQQGMGALLEKAADAAEVLGGYVYSGLASIVRAAVKFILNIIPFVRQIARSVGRVVNKLVDQFNEAVNRVIRWIADRVRGVIRRVTGRGGEEEDEEEPAPHDPAKESLINRGLEAIHHAELFYAHDNTISRNDAEKVADEVRSAHPVFTKLVVIDGGDRWKYYFEASPGDSDWADFKKPEEELSAPSNAFEAYEEGLRVRRPQDIGIRRPERHHIFPQQHRQFFADRGFTDIDSFTIPLDDATHDAIHLWMGSGTWNSAIVERILAQEAENVPPRQLTRREIMQVGAQMRREAGLQHIKVIPYRD